MCPLCRTSDEQRGAPLARQATREQPPRRRGAARNSPLPCSPMLRPSACPHALDRGGRRCRHRPWPPRPRPPPSINAAPAALAGVGSAGSRATHPTSAAGRPGGVPASVARRRAQGQAPGRGCCPCRGLPPDRTLRAVQRTLGQHAHGPGLRRAERAPDPAIGPGVVTQTAYDGAYGNKTVVRLDDGTVLWYCHQSEFGVEPGPARPARRPIGYVGSTGNVTGPHLHLEVHPRRRRARSTPRPGCRSTTSTRNRPEPVSPARALLLPRPARGPGWRSARPRVVARGSRRTPGRPRRRTGDAARPRTPRACRGRRASRPSPR